MTEDKGILIKNIYYMLTYAFQVLKQTNYDEIASEPFEQIQDLFAAILAKGISSQLKQGLYREYHTKTICQPVMRGKLNLSETMQNQIRRKQSLCCESDELSENHILNQILKTTAHILIHDPLVSVSRKMALKKNMLFFRQVDLIPPSSIPWGRLQFHQNNKNYQMLMNICYFVLNYLLQTTEKGTYQMMAFSEESMAKLYEKFVLSYFKAHHSYLQIASSQVKWNVSHAAETGMIQFLPTMQTDITLRDRHRTLIIDTKYYAHTMQSRFDSHKIHSDNLYQIFTYVKNEDAQNTGNVSGLLLYAKTEEAITPDCSFLIGGNRIEVKTLDLNTDFQEIMAQLDQIVFSVFGVDTFQQNGKTL